MAHFCGENVLFELQWLVVRDIFALVEMFLFTTSLLTGVPGVDVLLLLHVLDDGDDGDRLLVNQGI